VTDAGFDFSVLSEFRTRLIAGAVEERLLTTLLKSLMERGLLKERGSQRTDSTHIVAAVRALNRMEMVGETLHYALNVLAHIAPDWLREQVTAEWFVRYGKRFSDYPQPKGHGERQELAETIGRDGLHLLTEIYRDSAPPYVRAVPAVEILRQVQVLFPKKVCAACEVRARCTRSKTGPRELTLHPKAQHLALQAARERQQTETFKERYKRRAGIEGTMSQAAFVFGMRQTRYRGLPKTHFHHIATATAINLQRFVDWLWEIPRSQTYRSHFARLALAA
jgi:hypothetical protein